MTIKSGIRQLKSRIRQAAFNQHYWIEQLNSKSELETFLSRFREKLVSCELVRIGGEGDGGYLHPKNLNDISYCYSPGVSSIADFEKELSDSYDIKSFMADASVNGSPISDDNFEFIPKFLGAHSKNEFITLTDWISETAGKGRDDKILQMDIEGGEYDVLIFEDSETLASFSTMIIEFHSLQKLFEKDFLRMSSAIFEKIYKNFSICHVHPNNAAGLAELDGISIPRTIEVTFIRNDLLDRYSNQDNIELPHPLDRKNVQNNDDILMPQIWWKKY